MADVANTSPSFFAKLKQHHIYRVAAWYGASIAILIQIVARAFPYFGWSMAVPAVIIILIAGFPVAIVLAWLLVKPTDPAAQTAWQRRHWKLGAVVTPAVIAAVVVSGIYAFRLTENHAEHLAEEQAVPKVADNPAPSRITVIPAKSIAVLPFANESGTRSEQFFSDGLSEDLITALSQFSGLKVISRNSAFQFRDSKDDANTIGEKLGVAHLLEGSVQRAGNKLRITATLVKASDGSIVWSQRYDKPYQDLFALQDAITEAVAGALQAKLLTVPGAVLQSDRPPGGNLDAYTAYQHGIAYDALGTEVGQRRAIDAYHEAIHLDPRYAVAYAQLSRAFTGLAGQFPSGSAEIALSRDAARKASDTALQLDPDSSQAHLARAYLHLYVDMDWTGAEAESLRALQLSPNDAAAQFGLGHALSSLGQNRRAVELTQQALASDPRHASWYSWLGNYLAALGRLDEARRAVDTSIALQPGAVSNHEALAIIAILRGDGKAALAAAQQESPGLWQDSAAALALQVSPDLAAADAALERLVKGYASDAPYQIAEVYALRKDPGNVFTWLNRAWTSRDPGINSLLSDPLILRYKDDPRFAVFCKKVGLPITTDAVAMKL